MGRVVPLLLLFAGCGWEERPTCTVTEEVLDRVEDAELGVDTEALDALLGAEHVGLGEHLAALGVLSFIGVLAGVLPAYRAAMIQPITALRTE